MSSNRLVVNECRCPHQKASTWRMAEGELNTAVPKLPYPPAMRNHPVASFCKPKFSLETVLQSTKGVYTGT